MEKIKKSKKQTKNKQTKKRHERDIQKSVLSILRFQNFAPVKSACSAEFFTSGSQALHQM